MPETKSRGASSDFDYSSPEAIEAMRRALDLVLEVREAQIGPLQHKIDVYERTFGLAVIPALLWRAWRARAARRAQKRLVVR